VAHKKFKCINIKLFFSLWVKNYQRSPSIVISNTAVCSKAKKPFNLFKVLLNASSMNKSFAFRVSLVDIWHWTSQDTSSANAI